MLPLLFAAIVLLALIIAAAVLCLCAPALAAGAVGGAVGVSARGGRGCSVRRARPLKVERLVGADPRWKFTGSFPASAKTLGQKIWLAKKAIKQKIQIDAETEPLPRDAPLPEGFHLLRPPRGASALQRAALRDIRALFKAPGDIPINRFRGGFNIDFLFDTRGGKDPPYVETRPALRRRAPKLYAFAEKYARYLAEFYRMSPEVFDRLVSFHVARYHRESGLWLHLDNAARRGGGPITTVGLGVDTVYDLTPTFTEGEPIRVTMAEGDIAIMDGPARIEWAHGLPYGRKEYKYTMMFLFEGMPPGSFYSPHRSEILDTDVRIARTCFDKDAPPVATEIDIDALEYAYVEPEPEPKPEGGDEPAPPKEQVPEEMPPAW